MVVPRPRWDKRRQMLAPGRRRRACPWFSSTTLVPILPTLAKRMEIEKISKWNLRWIAEMALSRKDKRRRSLSEGNSKRIQVAVWMSLMPAVRGEAAAVCWIKHAHLGSIKLRRMKKLKWKPIKSDWALMRVGLSISKTFPPMQSTLSRQPKMPSPAPLTQMMRTILT